MVDAPTKMIDSEFDSFMTAIGLAKAPDFQRRDMRRAFFAGAVTFYSLLLNNASSGDDITDADVAMVGRLEAELNAFRDSIGQPD